MEVELTRNIVAVVLGSALLSACVPPEVESRMADLENKVADLEKKVAEAPAARPGAAAKPPVDDAAEKAAAELLKAASQAAEQMNYDEAKAKLAELKANHGETRAARAAQRLESELEIIGKPASDLMVEKWFTGEGEVTSLSDGKATMLVFWEVWCPHCKREVPKLSETYGKYKDKGFQVVGLTKLTRNTTEEAVASFISENSVAYPTAKEEGDAMSQHYGVRGIPAAAVVKDGKVVWRGHPARVTDAMIDGWLGS